MTLDDYKREFLLHLVRSGAIRFGSFRLKSGRLSPYFINIADAMRTGSDAVKVANAYAARIEELDIGLIISMVLRIRAFHLRLL